MAYTINLTDGTVIATVQNGTIDNTSTSLTLVGKNYAGYGEFVAENFVWMLENSANATAPAVPLTGQLWYDSSASILKVYNGDAFKNLASAIAQEGAPTDSIIGDMWFDTINSQLNVYDGNTFILIGPAFSSGTGTSGSIVDTIIDTIAVEHIVIKFFASDAVVAIVSKDTSFTPRPEDVVPGFTTIEPGIQLATSIGAAMPQFTGTATHSLISDDSLSLGGEVAANYLRSDINDETAGTLTVQTNMELSASGSQAILNNTDTTGFLRIQSGGSDVIVIEGTSNRARVNDPIFGTDIMNRQTAYNNFVELAGDTMTGTLTVEALAPGVWLKETDQTDNDILFVLDGGTLQFQHRSDAGVLLDTPLVLDMNTDEVRFNSTPATALVPSADDDITNKKYVDDTVTAVFNALYPVGAIFIGADPSTVPLMPGTWTAIPAGTFLQAVGNSTQGALGSTGGANTKTLAIAEMPSHNHGGGSHTHTERIDGQDGGTQGTHVSGTVFATSVFNSGIQTGGPSTTVVQSQGSGTAWNSRPQYHVVQMWRRTS